MAELKLMRDEFFTYLSTQMPSLQLSDACQIFSNIEAFCLQRKILQKKIFETTELKIINQVVQTVDSNRVFRFTYKSNLKKMSNVIHAYYTFFKHYRYAEKVEDIQSKDNDKIDSPIDINSGNMEPNNSGDIIKLQPEKVKNQMILLRYKELLDEFFSKGFRMNSSLDMKKLRRFYQEQYGMELSDKDECIYKNIRSVTILYDGKAYLSDSMLSSEKKEKLVQYIADTFCSGCDVIYYDTLFIKFEEVFQGEHIYTTEMLKTYLSYINQGKFVLRRGYIAKNDNVQINLEDEIREYLKEVKEPVKVTRLSEIFSYIPEQKIKLALSTHGDFVWNATGVYFHESCFNLSNSELEWISQFIEDGIEKRDFVTGNELVEAVEIRFPDIKEMYQEITTIGKRNAIAYKLQGRFSFNGNIVSKFGENLSMAEVYTKYCRKHSKFTLDELNVLKQELGSTIYFDEIYANSLRISQNEFVSLNMAQFDIEATDKAIERICTGQYMPIQAVCDFGIFPYAGYQWNEFLLEHFVANYSEKFKLLHIGYSANLCAGAIVKRTSSFETFNELLINVLANSNVILDEEAALEYLCQQGYIGRRRYSDIGKLLTEAKIVRSKKG